jgi:hypothetical protein
VAKVKLLTERLTPQEATAMTARLTLDIFCDGCGGWEHADGTLNKHEGRANVQRQYGWTSKRVDGKLIDLCPNCKTGSAPNISRDAVLREPAIAVTITDLRKIYGH